MNRDPVSGGRHFTAHAQRRPASVIAAPPMRQGGRGDPPAQPAPTRSGGRGPRAGEGAATMTETAVRTRAGITARIWVWVRRCQGELSARVYAAGDEEARRHG